MRADLRADGYRCHRCGAPLADAPVLRRRWRKIRSGDFAGDRGEFVTLRCGCGERRRLLWTVQLAPWRGRAA